MNGRGRKAGGGNAVLFYGITGVCLWMIDGNYPEWAIGLFAVAFAALVGSFFFRKSGPAFLPWPVLGTWLVVGLSALLFVRPLLLREAEGGQVPILKPALALALLAALVLALGQLRRKTERAGSREMTLTVACLAVFLSAHVVSRLTTLIVIPDPAIDVHRWISEAADYFLSGRNPYGRVYTDINACLPNGPRYPPVFNYLPGVLVWVTPFQWIWSEIRVGFLLADLLTTFCLYRIGRQHRLPTAESMVLPMLWLSLPIQLQVLQYAWVDTLLITGVAVLLVLLGDRRYLLAGLVLGGLLLVKQYAFPIGLVSFVWLWSRGQRREARLLVLRSGLVFAAGMLPFFLANPSVFYYSVVKSLANQAFRADAFTLTALLQPQGLTVSGLAYGLIAVGTLTGVLLRLWLRHAATIADWAEALIIFYGVVFLLAKQAFCNYYQFFAFFVLVYVATQGARAERGQASPLGAWTR